MNKTILLASFISHERIDWFLDYLNTKFSVDNDKVFGYNNLEDNTKIILTFRLIIDVKNPLNLKKLFPSAVIIHKKGDCLYTINALNRLINEKFPESVGNIDNKNIKIDWSEYQNKFILTKDEKLSIFNISRAF
jgi:hypothetical protein